MAKALEIDRNLRTLQWRRKLAIVIVAFLCVPLLFLVAPIWQPGSWEERLVRGSGLTLIFLAILGRSWCTLYIGGRKVRHLVTTGPYSITRNPLYLFSFAAIAGLGAQTGSLTIALLLTVTAYAIFLPVVRREEMALQAIHGAQFTRYRQAVPRFAVQFSRWKEAAVLDVDPRIWRRTALDGLFFVLLVPAAQAIALVQHRIDVLPLLRLP